MRLPPARVLDTEERSDLEKGDDVRKVGNRVPCAAGCGRMRSHFRLDPTTRPNRILQKKSIPSCPENTMS